MAAGVLLELAVEEAAEEAVEEAVVDVDVDVLLVLWAGVRALELGRAALVTLKMGDEKPGADWFPCWLAAPSNSQKKNWLDTLRSKL